MKLARRQRITLVLILSILLLNVCFRIHIRKKIRIHKEIRACHEKLVVAYESGGRSQLQQKIDSIRLHDKRPAAQEFLDNLQAKLNQARDPGVLLHSLILRQREDILHLKHILLILNIMFLTAITIRILISIIRASAKP